MGRFQIRQRDAIGLDWMGSGMDGAIEVTTLRGEYLGLYQRYPESKAADRDGNPAGPDTIGLLGRLRVRSGRLLRIGKEVDRLSEDEGASLGPELPVEYGSDDLAQDTDCLATFPQQATARTWDHRARMAQDHRKAIRSNATFRAYSRGRRNLPFGCLELAKSQFHNPRHCGLRRGVGAESTGVNFTATKSADRRCIHENLGMSRTDAETLQSDLNVEHLKESAPAKLSSEGYDRRGS
jgi:hypothetical protein